MFAKHTGVALVLALVVTTCLGGAANNYTVIGQTAIDMTFPPSCFEAECLIGDFVTDAFRIVSGAQLAIDDAGFVRGGLLTGPITHNMIQNVRMWQDYISVINITGHELKLALENGVSVMDTTCPRTWDGRFGQVSGLSYTVNCSAPAGSRVTSIVLDSPYRYSVDQNYTIAVNDYILTGGDGYSMFVNKTARFVATSAQVIERYLATLPSSTIYPGTIKTNRITFSQPCSFPDCSSFVLGVASDTIPYNEDAIRSFETELGDLAADVLFAECQGAPCDLSIIGPDSLLGGFEYGNITQADIVAALSNSTSFNNYVEVQYSLIKSVLESFAGPLGTACFKAGLLQVSSTVSYTMNCNLPLGNRITSLAIQGIPYSNQTESLWFQVMTTPSLAQFFNTTGGRHLQPYAIDMRTFWEEYIDITASEDVIPDVLGSRLSAEACTPASCASVPPFATPPPVVFVPSAPSQICAPQVVDGLNYNLYLLFNQPTFSYFDGRYQYKWSICAPLQSSCGTVGGQTSAACIYDTIEQTYVSIGYASHYPITTFTPTDNGGVAGPNATSGVSIDFYSGTPANNRLKADILCDPSSSTVTRAICTERPPSVECEVYTSAGCPTDALPPAVVPQSLYIPQGLFFSTSPRVQLHLLEIVAVALVIVLTML